MKKATIKLGALMLIITLIVTLSAPMYANAEEDKSCIDFKFSDEQPFIKTEIENGAHYELVYTK